MPWKRLERSSSQEAVMILSSNKVRGIVLRDLPLSKEKVVLPSGVRNCLFEGGRQIDPYLLAAVEVQELQRRIETLLDGEQQMKHEISELQDKWKRAELQLKEKEDSLRDKIREEGLLLHRKESERGFKEGYGKGLATAEKEIEEKLRHEYSDRFSQTEELLIRALKSLEQSIEKDIEINAPKMVRLWQIMLKRLLRTRVELDEDVALRVFRELMTRVSDRGKVKLFINPSDKDLFLSRSDEMAEIKRVAELFEIIGDDNIERGSCILETNLGVHDARWSSQLEAINGQIDLLVREI